MTCSQFDKYPGERVTERCDYGDTDSYERSRRELNVTESVGEGDADKTKKHSDRSFESESFAQPKGGEDGAEQRRAGV